MPSQPNHRTPKHARRRKRRRHRLTLKTLRRFVRARWRTFRTVRKAMHAWPLTIRAVVIPTTTFLFLLGFNWTYHAFNKPAEILFPLDHSLNKSPAETWKQYGSLFRKHATSVMTPELLAALAQAEGAGNPAARTYWQWHLTWNPLELYQPASSAVGMYQITDGTFREAKRYCIHNHRVVEDGPWDNPNSCWFNNLYTRVLPRHAIQLISALLDRRVASAIALRPSGSLTLWQKQNLAAVIHLCGATAGRVYVTRGFRLSPHQRCGSHDVRNYLTRFNAIKQQFARLAAVG